jgi:hypothetical protein
VLLELRTPLIKESCLSKEALETMKFISFDFSTYKYIESPVYNKNTRDSTY